MSLIKNGNLNEDEVVTAEPVKVTLANTNEETVAPYTIAEQVAFDLSNVAYDIRNDVSDDVQGALNYALNGTMVAKEASNKADAASCKAETASTSADSAGNKAEAAYCQANNAYDFANSAYDIANAAYYIAGSIYNRTAHEAESGYSAGTYLLKATVDSDKHITFEWVNEADYKNA